MVKLPKEMFTQHIAVLGKTGSGKSSVLRLQIERLLDEKLPVCIIDPKGDWWGLKSSASGKSAGYPVVIFGGEHGDVPLNAHSGSHVAELIATGNRPCIIDLGGWMVSDRTRFFIDFASTLFRTTRGARYIVIDEVHNFAPQGKVLDPEAGKMLHWANRLASEGRGKGLTILSASQRPQKVHKDFLTCAETLIAMRVIHKLDRDAIKDWIDGAGDPAKGKEVLDTLASNQRGQGWVWSPEIKFGPKLITFPMFRTYDSFAPKANDGMAKLKGWASVDLDEVSNKLAKVVEEAKANDPAELKKRIRELEKQKAPTATSVTNSEKYLDEIRAKAAMAERKKWEPIVSAAEATMKKQRGQLDRIAELAAKNGEVVKLERPQLAKAADIPVNKTRTIPESRPQRPKREQVATNAAADPGELTKTQRRILDTVATLDARGILANRESVARWQAIHPNGGRYGSDLAWLRANGYLNGFTLVGPGSEAANIQATGPEAVIAVLPDGTKQKLFRTILDATEPFSRETLAEELGIHPNGGRYGSDLAWLRTMGVISERGPIVATEGALR